jgi:hypothetical protein
MYFIMQIGYVKISCKEDVHICRTNFEKKMERNWHETTSWWKMYGKGLGSLRYKTLKKLHAQLTIAIHYSI